MSVRGQKSDVLITGSLSRVDSGRDRRNLKSKGTNADETDLSFYMSDMGSSLPNMSKNSKSLTRSDDSQSSSFYNSPDMSPKSDQIFKFDLIGPGSKKIGYTVCTSSSTSKLLRRPKPKPVVSLSSDSSPTGPHKFLRESRSLDREDETDRFPEPRQLRRQETFDSSTSSVQALQDKISNNNVIGRPPLRTAKSFDFGYQSANSGESQSSLQQPPSGSDTLQVMSTSKAVPSPATKRRITYFQKLASSVLSGSRSSSSGPFSPRDRKSTSGSGESLSGLPSSPDYNSSSDEGGFDTFSPPSSPTVMYKGRQSTSPSIKFIPKKIWRTKSKPQPASSTPSTLWNPEGNCRWHSVSGRTVTLTTTTLMQLSELEKRQLQKVAHQRLQNMHLGPIITPKDPLTKRPKKGSFLRGRHRNNSVLDSLKDIGKEGKEPSAPLVFGIPIEKCICNENALKRYHSTRRKERRESLDLAQSPLLARQQGKQLKGSAEDLTSVGHASSSGSSSSPSTSLLDALSLSTSTQVEAQWRERRKSLLPQEPKIPQVVKACFNHIEKRGLHILGIFRIGGSKKRTRQLREDYDAGNEIILNDNHNPHDVGALLKEFFRDLPEPLLTRELYPAFVACTRLENFDQRMRALQLLVYLLPTANRDTLHALLHFLNQVSKNSADTVDNEGKEILGNRMDVHNLAILFGPNILRKTKGGQERDSHPLEATEQVEESREVISVVKVMTEHMDVIFQVPAEIQDSVLRITYETDPEALDYLLTKRAVALGCLDPSEMEASFAEDVDNHSSSPPCTPEEILMPFHALHGHEHRLYSSPDDLYTCRNKADFTDETLGHVTREQMLQQSKQKSLSLPRAAPVIDSRFPSSPKIARTGCEDRSASTQSERSSKVKRGRHSSSESQDENSQWGAELSPTTTISPPTRLTRGISNEKQIFSPLSPHSPRRISGGPVSPLVGHPPERQFSSPATMDAGSQSPSLDVPTIPYQSKSPRTVRKHASDLLPSPWKFEDASDQIWLPVDSRRTQSVSDCIKPSRPCSISPCLQRRTAPRSPQPRLAKVPIAAMEEDFDMDLPLEVTATSPTSPKRDNEKWQGEWKLKDGQETLV